jgi:alternate signal-mediated exported protein
VVKHAVKIVPDYDNPTLAELAWVRTRKGARLTKAILRSVTRKGRGTDHRVKEPGSRHIRAAAPTQPGTPGPRHAWAAGSDRAPVLGSARADSTATTFVGKVIGRAKGLTRPLKTFWRRPAFAAALAGTVAMAFPLALILGGNAHTFALWHASEEVDGGAVTAGDLDAQKGNWILWSQVVPVGTPPVQGAVETEIERGTCLKPADHQSKCADDSDPFSAFRAMPGDKVKLVGQFKSVLDGDNIAAVLTVDWDSRWPPDDLPVAVDATYTVSASATPAIPATFQTLKDEDGERIVKNVGSPFKIITVTDGNTPVAELSNGAVMLDPGIHTAGEITWQVEVTLVFGSDDPGDYLWDDPASEADTFTVPLVTVELEQVRAGEGWGVAVP